MLKTFETATFHTPEFDITFQHSQIHSYIFWAMKEGTEKNMT